jgi:hypothetical protein
MTMRRLILCAALAVAACDDEAGPIDPGQNETGTLTVDASGGWAWVAFADGEATAVSVDHAAASADWDVAFRVTSVMLNGGAAGPGSVSGHCVCQNAGASDADVIAMTAASELADFEAVTSADIPASDEAWLTEELQASLSSWYSYDPMTHVVSPAPSNVYAVRTASGTSFAKLHVIGLEGGTAASAGTVTLAYALQDSAGAPFGDVDTVSVAVNGGSVRFDLESGAETTGDDWDLWLEGWTIRLNGGASGTGTAGAYLTGEAFASIDDASAAPASAYASDRFAGVFGAHAWYRYNLQNDHQVYPTYEVYLISTPDGVYKIQLTGYYGPTGDPRQIGFRYAKLD